MDAAKRARLEAAGWRSGNAEDFLEMPTEDVALVEIKLALSGEMGELRGENHRKQSHAANPVDRHA